MNPNLDFGYFPVAGLALTQDLKIGSIECYAQSYGRDGIGNQEVYAGGWATLNDLKTFYIKEKNGKLEDSKEVVKRILESIFDNEELNGYTFYAHNLGRFDAVFLLKSVILLKNIKIKTVFKDNSIISITLQDINTKRKIYCIRFTTIHKW